MQISFCTYILTNICDSYISLFCFFRVRCVFVLQRSIFSAANISGSNALFLFHNDSVELFLALLDEKRAVLKHVQRYLLFFIGDLFAVYEETALFDGAEAFAVARNESQFLDERDESHAFTFKAGLFHLCRRHVFHISGSCEESFCRVSRFFRFLCAVAYAIAAFKNGTSINPETPEEVDEVVETLKAQKPLVQAYVMDEIFDKMIGGEAAIGVYYSGDAITMIDDNPDLAWVFPEEGSVLSVDCMAVPATSEHKEAAEMFINFMCEPDIGKANAEYIGYTTPMQKVWDILDEDLKYSEIAYPSEEVEAKEKVFTALSDEVNNELDVKWSEMKSYDEGGSGVVFLMLLLAMVALACLIV